MCTMTKQYVNLAFPQILSCLIYEIVMQLNIIFIGQLNDATKLAGVGLANMITNVLGISILCGINDAQSTLTSHAYGANNLHLCGVYLNRGKLILISVYLPLAVGLLFSKQTLMALG